MDYLQYYMKKILNVSNHTVLNLIINGLPSIQEKEKWTQSLEQPF